MKEPSEVTCTPDHPFGCPTSWGRQLFSNFSEARTHVCNLGEHHNGAHRCHCGEEDDGLPLA